MTSEMSRLLDAGRAFDAEYGRATPNHRSTALWSLASLGADDARLVQWAAVYETRLHPAPPPEPWPSGEAWPPRLGHPRAWPAYRSLFAEWLHNESVADVLTPVLPQLMQGCAGASFQGLARLACAVQSGHGGDLADALAYWACRWWPAPAAAGSRTADNRTLQALAEQAADACARSGHRVAQQLVTSAQAMGVLLPYLDDAAAAAASLSAWRRAFDCAWTALPASPAPLAKALPWDTITAAAVAASGAHKVELVAACRHLHAAFGGSIWQRAATRAVDPDPVA